MQNCHRINLLPENTSARLIINDCDSAGSCLSSRLQDFKVVLSLGDFFLGLFACFSMRMNNKAHNISFDMLASYKSSCSRKSWRNMMVSALKGQPIF